MDNSESGILKGSVSSIDKEGTESYEKNMTDHMNDRPFHQMAESRQGLPKVAAVIGPTASGKSDLAVFLANQIDGEIISADSMQVYRKMDIGTAKASSAQQKQAPHHLIDIRDPDEPWNVALFQQECRRAIKEIQSRGKIPILCGGTGLYVKAALYDYEFEAEEKQSSELEKQLDALTNEQLVDILKESDPDSLEKIHPNNRKRLLRAAAMAKRGTPKSQREAVQNHHPIYDLFLIGLRDQREMETKRIDQRVDQMFEQGLEQEVTALFSDRATWQLQSFQAIGYKEFLPLLKELQQGQSDQTADDQPERKDDRLIKQTKEEIRESIRGKIKDQIKIHTRQYAKRQMTWFRNQMPVRWYSPGQRDQILPDLQQWLREVPLDLKAASKSQPDNRSQAYGQAKNDD